MTEIFVAEIGQLTVGSKRQLRKAGVVVVEVKALTRCQFVRAATVLSGDELLWASVAALNVKGGYREEGQVQRNKFVENLTEIMKGKGQNDDQG